MSTALESVLSDDSLLAIVHDLRACLRKSLTGVQFLERLLGENVERAIRERLDSTLAANREMERFLGRLSDYANAGRLSNSRPLPLTTLVSSAVLQFPSAHIDMASDVGPAANLLAPHELVRVFIELIDNAVKFSRNSVVAIRYQAEGSSAVSVMICDNGVGIPKSEEQNVFGLLVRLHSADEFPGFGIGLAICKRTADALGVTVRFAANAQGGTIASISVNGD